MFCPKCGNILSDSDKFCTSCGARVEPVQQGTRVNSACGHPHRTAELPAVTPGEAVRLYFSRYADFSGRSRRSEYWGAQLVIWIISAVWACCSGRGACCCPCGPWQPWCPICPAWFAGSTTPAGAGPGCCGICFPSLARSSFWWPPAPTVSPKPTSGEKAPSITNLTNLKLSLRTSAHAGVAISGMAGSNARPFHHT